MIATMWSETDSMTSLVKGHPSIPFKLFISLPFSLIILSAFYGASIMKVIFFNSIAFLISTMLKAHRAAPIVLWTYCISILFLNYYFDGYKFGDISNSLSWLDQVRGLKMRWDGSFNFAILRMISFGMDYYWLCQGNTGEVCRIHIHSATYLMFSKETSAKLQGVHSQFSTLSKRTH
jgi:hypothetical protein